MHRAAPLPRWSYNASYPEQPGAMPRTHSRMDFESPAVLCGVDRRTIVTVPNPADIEALCAAKGMRMTEQRRVIARVLATSGDHPGVEELYVRCVAIDDRISISTVYRTVKLFEEIGIIERHDFRDGRARYEQAPDTHHDHLINLRTGEVTEFSSEEIEKLQAEIARRLGYRLVDHRLELYALPLDDQDRKR
jgi:Fur family ferric uptake transcriptional regulator